MGMKKPYFPFWLREIFTGVSQEKPINMSIMPPNKRTCQQTYPGSWWGHTPLAVWCIYHELSGCQCSAAAIGTSLLMISAAGEKQGWMEVLISSFLDMRESRGSSSDRLVNSELKAFVELQLICQFTVHVPYSQRGVRLYLGPAYSLPLCRSCTMKNMVTFLLYTGDAVRIGIRQTLKNGAEHAWQSSNNVFLQPSICRGRLCRKRWFI